MSLSKLLLMALLLCAGPVRGAEVQVAQEASVPGEQVMLGDVATIYAKDPAVFQALAKLVLSRLPDDGTAVHLPAAYVEARARAALPSGEELTFRAPAEIVLRRQASGLSARDFAAEVERQAKAGGKVPGGVELEVEVLSGLERLQGLTLASVRIDPPAEIPQWRGELSFKVARADDAGSPPVWVRARVRWFHESWIANRAILFSEAPDPSMFTRMRVETTSLREEPLDSDAEGLAAKLHGAKFRRSLVANAPLVPSALERRPDAQAGANLRVVFVSESGVRVSADGQLVGAGAIGEDVKARLRSSKKLVTGRLMSPSLVEVSL